MKMKEKCSVPGALVLLAAVFLLLIPGPSAHAGESERITVISQIMFGPKEAYAPEKLYEERGRSYRLERWELEDITIEPRSRSVEQEVLFEEVEEMAPVPDTYEISAKEDFSGLMVKARYPAIRTERGRERWKDDFSFPVVFHSYGAEFYLLGDMMVQTDAESPWLEGCEEALLREIGASADNYRIARLEWEGAPYLNENQEFCRNARAWGKRRVADYRVVYGGTVTFPQAEGYRCRAVYQSVKPEGQGEEETVGEEKAAEEKEKEEVKEKDSRWSVWREAITVTVSMLLALVLIIFAVWLTKRLRASAKGHGERQAPHEKAREGKTGRNRK